jgi:hypothetical protein
MTFFPELSEAEKWNFFLNLILQFHVEIGNLVRRHLLEMKVPETKGTQRHPQKGK